MFFILINIKANTDTDMSKVCNIMQSEVSWSVLLSTVCVCYGMLLEIKSSYCYTVVMFTVLWLLNSRCNKESSEHKCHDLQTPFKVFSSPRVK